MKVFRAAVAAAVAMGYAASAGAVTQLTFAAPGPGSQLYLNGYEPGTTTIDPAIHALLDVNLLGVSDDGYTWNFGYSLQNTSTTPARLATLGFDVDPNLSSVSGLSGLFGNYATGGQISSLGTAEVCLKASGGTGCTGGGSGGLQAGENGAGLFSLSFAQNTTYFTTVQVPVYNSQGRLIRTDTVQVAQSQALAAPNQVTLSDFGVHWQSLADGSSTVGIAGDPPAPLVTVEPPSYLTAPLAIPEPASWVMMILGFGSVGALLRRRRVAFGA